MLEIFQVCVQANLIFTCFLLTVSCHTKLLMNSYWEDFYSFHYFTPVIDYNFFIHITYTTLVHLLCYTEIYLAS